MWWLTLALTLGLMGLFHLLTRAGPVEARATIALGFLLIAAHLGGELAKRLRLPRITGFLLTGFVVGPPWLGLVRRDELDALRFITDGAMALIAFAAGSELSLAVVKETRRSLARFTAGAMLFPLAAVTLAMLALSPWFPLTVHQPFGDRVAVALILGVFAAASSPVFTVALMDESDARGAGRGGPFARGVLSVSIAQDVAVVLLFAIVLLVARPLASAGALDLSLAWATLLRLVGSIAAGVAVGFTVDRYRHAVSHDTPLFLVALAFLSAELAQAAGLEVMLVALAAGFYLRNFAPSPGEREPLRAQLVRWRVPVSVAFFALAGADIRVDELQDVLFWAVLLVGLRAFALRAGTRWAGGPGSDDALARQGWLGLISQAGIALGLAATARRAFPEWGVSLQSLVVAMVGLHQVAGPLCFRRALRLAGELTETEHVTTLVPDSAGGPPSGGGGV